MRANPYVLTFDDGADGGPEHLLWVLTGFYCKFMKQGELVFEGVIKEVESSLGEVLVEIPIDERPDLSGPDRRRLLDIYEDFDEVIYQ
jgi:hypothetical protein